MRIKITDKYEIKQPTLYSYLKRLQDDNLITSYWGESSNGGRRRYYTLTAEGKQSCQAFVSEWEYQRSVISTLVDGTAEAEEISQENATPLFGRRSQKKAKKSDYQANLDEQDEIARRLAMLTGEDPNASSDNDDTAEYQKQPDPIAVDTVNQDEVVEDDASLEQETYQETAQEQEVAQEPTQEELEEQQRLLAEQEALRRQALFDVKQDNVEDFMQDFDRLAQEVSERQPDTDANPGENYQHVLMGVVGDQLDDMRQYDIEQQSQFMGGAHFGKTSPTLEDIADSLAQDGIRMRIYNHATANYKSKSLIPMTKILRDTAWLTYLVGFLYFGIIALTSISINNWQPFLIVMGVLLLLPIVFTCYAFMEPVRKEKPAFNFRKVMLASLIIFAIIALGAVAISAFSNTQFSNWNEVATRILIPVGIALLLPSFAFIFNTFYEKY